MMQHLSPQEFVEVIDGSLAPSRSRHLEQCEACRREAGDLQALMSDVQITTDAPEPSPLFWDHFTRRVLAATSADAIPVISWWTNAWRPIVALGAVMAVAVTAVLLGPAQAPTLPTELVALGGAPEAADDSGGISTESSWDLVALMAADMPWDELQQVAQPTPDATGGMIEELTPAQRAEFIRLIKSEMGGVE